MTTRKWKGEFLVNTATVGMQMSPAAAPLATGGFIIAWDDFQTGQMTAQAYDAQGYRVGGQQLLQPFWTVGSNPDLALLSTGDVWNARRASIDVLGEVRTAAGGFVRDQGVATVGGAGDRRVELAALTSGGGVMVWNLPPANAGDIVMQGFNGDGTSRFAAVTVNTDALGTLAATQAAPDVAATRGGGKFAIAWEDRGTTYDDIRVRIYDHTGAAITSELTPNAVLASFLRDPSVAWLDEANLVVAWTNVAPESINGGDGSGSSIRFKIVNAAGEDVTGVLFANTTRAGAQENPVVASLPDGGFVIAWVDRSALGIDTVGSAIKLQVFDSWGAKRGAEITVNTTTNNFQLSPAVTALSDGRVLVTWQDDSQSGGDLSSDAIRAQIVDPRDGVVDGTGGNDVLYGHDALGDIISGGDGQDTANGLAGNDTLHGGGGNDTLNGSKGDDILFGGDGNDTLVADQGDDDQFGETGNDNLRGSAGLDILDGGAGIDTANFGSSTSAITVALDGSLVSTGDASGDSFTDIEDVWGTNASIGDTLVGNGAHNALFGFTGNDSLRGQNGNDQLIGGAGSDTLRGDAGDDRYNYNALTEGGDIMLDFGNSSNNNDAFQFRASVFLAGGAALPIGMLATTRFISRAADNMAQDADDTFIFQTGTRQLWYDSSGNATAGDAVLIATLQAGGTMSHVDVLMF